MPKPIDEMERIFESQPRNPVIAKLFRLAHLSENLGYGLRKLKSWQEVAGLPMHIDASINSVKVTFDLQRRDISTADDAKNVGVNVGVNVDELPDLQKFILKTIKSSPTITAKELSVQMSVSQRSIERHIAKLRELKLVSREGSDKIGRWIVANM